jgi:hypothetical protein
MCCSGRDDIVINRIPLGTSEIAGSESVPTQMEAQLTTNTVQTDSGEATRTVVYIKTRNVL